MHCIKRSSTIILLLAFCTTSRHDPELDEVAKMVGPKKAALAVAEGELKAAEDALAIKKARRHELGNALFPPGWQGRPGMLDRAGVWSFVG